MGRVCEWVFVQEVSLHKKSREKPDFLCKAGPSIERRLQERLARRHALKGVLDGLPVVVRQLSGALALQDIDDKADDQSLPRT